MITQIKVEELELWDIVVPYQKDTQRMVLSIQISGSWYVLGLQQIDVSGRTYGAMDYMQYQRGETIRTLRYTEEDATEAKTQLNKLALA